MLPASPFNKAQFIIAILISSAVPLLLAMLAVAGLHPAFVTFVRAGCMFLAIAFLAALTMQNPLRIHPRDWPVLALSGGLLATGWYCSFRAITIAHVASAEGVFAVAPIFSILIHIFILRDSPFHISYIFIFFLSLIGVTLCLPSFTVSHPSNIGLLYALGAVFCHILSAITITRVYKLYPIYTSQNALAFVQYFFATLLFVPALFIVPISLTWPAAGKLLALALVIPVLHRTLMTPSVPRLAPVYHVTGQSVQPLLAIIIAWIFLPAMTFPDGGFSIRILSGAILLTLLSLAAQFIHRIGPSTVFRPIRWN